MAITPADVISKLGPAHIAGKLGIRRRTVDMWRTRNAFPRPVWADLMHHFPSDLDYETLLYLDRHAGRPDKVA